MTRILAQLLYMVITILALYNSVAWGQGAIQKKYLRPVKIITIPNSIELFDKNYFIGMTPCTFLPESYGTHRLTLKKEGYFDREIEIFFGNEVDTVITMERIAAKVKIAGRKSNVEQNYKLEEFNQITPCILILDYGVYNINISKKDHIAKCLRIHVLDTSFQSINVVLDEETKYGYLRSFKIPEKTVCKIYNESSILVDEFKKFTDEQYKIKEGKYRVYLINTYADTLLSELYINANSLNTIQDWADISRPAMYFLCGSNMQVTENDSLFIYCNRELKELWLSVNESNQNTNINFKKYLFLESPFTLGYKYHIAIKSLKESLINNKNNLIKCKGVCFKGQDTLVTEEIKLYFSAEKNIINKFYLSHPLPLPKTYFLDRENETLRLIWSYDSQSRFVKKNYLNTIIIVDDTVNCIIKKKYTTYENYYDLTFDDILPLLQNIFYCRILTTFDNKTTRSTNYWRIETDLMNDDQYYARGLQLLLNQIYGKNN